MATFAQTIPVLAYQDIAAAHDFLIKAFGFESGGLHRSPDGQVVHGEVRIGNMVVWLHRDTPEHHLISPAKADNAYSGLFTFVDDVDAHWQRARSAGALIEHEPADQPYGQREYGARDPEGHRWWFGKRL